MRWETLLDHALFQAPHRNVYAAQEKLVCLSPVKHSNRTFLLSASSAATHSILWASYYNWGRFLSFLAPTPSLAINIHTYKTKQPKIPSMCLLRGLVSVLQATCIMAQERLLLQVPFPQRCWGLRHQPSLSPHLWLSLLIAVDPIRGQGAG